MPFNLVWATYHFSLPVYAPNGSAGTQLPQPDHGSLNALGELHA